MIIRQRWGKTLPFVYVWINLITCHLKCFARCACLDLYAIISHLYESDFKLSAANLDKCFCHYLVLLSLLQLYLPILLLLPLLMLELTLDWVFYKLSCCPTDSCISELGRSKLCIFTWGLLIFHELFTHLLLVLMLNLPTHFFLVDLKEYVVEVVWVCG